MAQSVFCTRREKKKIRLVRQKMAILLCTGSIFSFGIRDRNFFAPDSENFSSTDRCKKIFF